MLSLLLIVLTSVSIIGFSEVKNVTIQSYSQNYQRMEDFASALGTMATSEEKSGSSVLNPKFLRKLEFFLQGNNLHFRVFNARAQQIYPKAKKNLYLPAVDFAKLKQGKKIHIKNNNEDLPALGYTKNPCTGVLLPWMSGKKMIGAIWLATKVRNVERPINIVKRNLFGALISAFIVGLVLSLILSLYATHRIKRLSRAIKKVAAGNFDIQLKCHGNDEIDQLASCFNQMVRTLKLSVREVKNQEKRRDQFMADASHEMRTPLTTINGILKGLQYNAIPESAKPKSISLMKRETERLIRLVNENLDYEKIRNNQINLIRTYFNSRKVIDDILIQLKQNAKRAGDKIVVMSPAVLPIYADRDRFTQIMVNLVQNAIQFTDNGKITISGHRIDHGTKISVKDNGIGMNQNQIKYIFERYFKADPSRSRAGKGEYGLGLSIVSSLIKQHGGTIGVKSELNHGAEFTIVLFDQGFERYIEK